MDNTGMSIDELRAAVYKAQRNPIKSKLSHSFSASSPLSSGETPESAIRSNLSSSSSGTVAGRSSYFPNNSTPRLGSKASTPVEGNAMRQEATPAYHPNLEHVFPTPSIYDMTLVLSSDVGIENFWNNIVEIFVTHYKAVRIVLAVPNDLTDVSNTPWGLKATWNSKTPEGLPSATRSNIRSEHDDDWENMSEYYTLDSNITTRRSSDTKVGPESGNTGVVYHALQRLDSEDQPLLDDSGIHRVIEREGRVVVLSREYTDVLGHVEVADKTPGGTNLKDIGSPNIVKPKQQKLRNPFDEPDEAPVVMDRVPPKSRFFVGSMGGLAHYEDFEQPISSPWSQSPAPSPAILSDASKNPFFNNTSSFPIVDESTFSPLDEEDPSYGEKSFFESIGMEGAFSVVHIPLVHPSTARQIALSGHSSARGQVPIAILSFMSEAIPYPANLVQNLTTFAPFVATSLSQALSHSNILHQLAYTPYNQESHSPRSPDTGSSYSGTQFRAPGPSSLEAAPGTPSTAETHTSPENNYFSRTSSLRRGASEESLQAITGAMLSPRADLQRSASLRNARKENESPPARPTLEHRRTPSAPSQLSSKRSPELSPRASHAPRARRRTVDSRSRSLLHSFGASLATSFQPSVSGSTVKRPRSHEKDSLPQPSSRLMRVIVDAIPVCVMTASPINGRITWVNERTLAYSGKDAEGFLLEQWSCLHPDEEAPFAKAWQDAIAKGEGFARQTRMRRFDGLYRWFMTRAVPLRDSQGGIVHWFGTMMDVHDQKMAEHDASKQKETEASESKYRSLAEASPQIVFAASSKAGITYANTQWFKFSGKTVHQTHGFGFFSQIHPSDRQKCYLPRSGQLDKDQNLSNEIRLRSRDGDYKWHLVKCICIEKLADEEVWLGTCTDINDHKMLEQRLQEAKDSAYRNMESKTRFLSNMSHEIRTPLIGITGMINFLLDTELSAEQLDYAHTVQQSAEALLAVINDILDLSKVEAGMMKLVKETFPIRAMVEDANELLSTLAMAKQLELNYLVEEDVPEFVIGDRIRLRQVLLNIVGNAIKFTTEGEIFTRCFVVPTAGLLPDEIVIGWETIDSGPGFSDEEGSVLFRPFSQVDGSLTRKHGGTGLGLVISKQLAELHGGGIKCTSTKGVGSTFTFTAKFEVASGRALEEELHVYKQPQQSWSPNTESGESIPDISFEILVLSHSVWSIVALNHHIRVVIPRGIKSNIVTSDNIEASIQAIVEPKGLIFTHIVVNLINQEHILELVRTVQADEKYQHCSILLICTPVIRNLFLDRAAKEKLMINMHQVHFVFKVAKPSKLSQFFDPSRERIESMDTRRQTAQEVVQSQKDVFTVMNENVGNKGYRVLLVEDNIVNQKVMMKYCTKAGLSVETANDGIQCLRIYSESPLTFNIILMDLHMPNLDGYQACAKIREMERTAGASQIPIIALSANVMSDVAERCELAGFTSYLSKPVAFNTLSARISELLRDVQPATAEAHS